MSLSLYEKMIKGVEEAVYESIMLCLDTLRLQFPERKYVGKGAGGDWFVGDSFKDVAQRFLYVDTVFIIVKMR